MKHKKIIISIVAVVLLVVASYGFTLAWLTDTDEVQNTITLGEVDTKIEEFGKGNYKICQIKNESSVSPCLVRARVTISPAELVSDIYPLIKTYGAWDWGENWTNGDWVYYDKVLDKNATTEVLFEVELTDTVIQKWTNAGIDTFDITVYEESVQAVVWKDGQEISAINNPTNANLIWDLYDLNLLEDEKE